MSERIQRPVFTREMKKSHTLLFPNMVDIHFRLVQRVLCQAGYKARMLTNEGPGPARTGQKYVHNDTCYPALLTIGQMIEVLEDGTYDPDKVVLILPQTGGGCRASNYISLLRKALKAAGLEQVPVLSLNLSGMEKQPGFRLSIGLLRRLLVCMAYGDVLMLLANQCRPYEVKKGSTDALTEAWIRELAGQFEQGKGLESKKVKVNCERIAADFHHLPVVRTEKVKAGVAGEIYVKYSALANNHLTDFLESQGCEVMVPGIMQFLLYAADMPLEDVRLYGGSRAGTALSMAVFHYLTRFEAYMFEALRPYPEFTIPASYAQLKEIVKPFIGTGCKMGEGWLLTAEMLELTQNGYGNIVCTQPFGCLPNHIAGKAMILKIRKAYPEANITAIDYDPGASQVNQENRIKLMLSIARENLQKSAV